MIRQVLSQSVSNGVRRPLSNQRLYRMLVTLSAVVFISFGLMTGGFQVSAELHPTSTSLTQADQALEPGARIEKEIAGGETHYYRITLAADQYLRVAVDQQVIEVTTSLLRIADEKPDEKLIEVDSAGTERVSVVSMEAASYRVAIQARKSALAGRYSVKIEEQRQAAPQDQDRIAAELAVAEGLRLTKQGKRESLLQAVEKYQAALTLWRSLASRQNAERQEEAKTLYLLALRFQDLGEPQQGLGFCLQSLELSRETADRFRECAALNSIGGFYYALGDTSKAIDYYQQSLALSRTIEDHSTELASLVNLGVAYKAQGESQRAIDYYNQSLPAARASGNARVEAAALSNLARLYDLQGDTRQALDFNSQALKLWRELGNLDGEAVTLKNLGALHESSGSRREALDYYNQALALSQSLGDLNREAHIRGDLARVHRDEGELAESRAQIERALFVFESLRDKLVASDLRSSFFAAQRRYYEFYVGLLMQLHQADSSAGHDAAALQASERARARALVEMLNEAQADIRQGVDASLLERERALQTLIGNKEGERLKLVKGKAAAAAITEAEKALQSLTAEYDQVQMRIRQTSPRYSALTNPEPLKLAEIQQQILDPDTLLLEYSLGEERSFLWAVTTDSIHSFTLPSGKEIENSVKQLYEAMAARGRKLRFEVEEKRQARIARADQEYASVAAALSRTLLDPVSDLLGKKRLLIVPDRVLHYLPFAALPVPVMEGQRNRGKERQKRGHGAASSSLHLSVSPPPLVVDHEIVNLPSATSLAVLRHELARREPAPKLVAVLADPVFDQGDKRVKAGLTKITMPATNKTQPFPGDVAGKNSAEFREAMAASLHDAGQQDDEAATREGIARLPFTRREAQSILAFSRRSESKLALDFDADRASAISADLGQYRYLHFATHGLINDRNPALSGLALSLVDRNGADQDGYLRAMDVFNLKLPAELVVLSGCRTGLGKEVRGEGMIGMTHGFLYAGAARVMVSLWNINDRATAELMQYFYRELLVKGQRPAAALRAAQIALWKEKKWQEPYYWAAFMLQGEPR